jgi:hypothetical protein
VGSPSEEEDPREILEADWRMLPGRMSRRFLPDTELEGYSKYEGWRKEIGEATAIKITEVS